MTAIRAEVLSTQLWPPLQSLTGLSRPGVLFIALERTIRKHCLTQSLCCHGRLPSNSSGIIAAGTCLQIRCSETAVSLFAYWLATARTSCLSDSFEMGGSLHIGSHHSISPEAKIGTQQALARTATLRLFQR